jgi:ergothioneine biosynthesis protein EgtB
LVERFRAVRARTESLAAPLSAEDQAVQSQPQSSPAKWHRAHTTWFFETFVLAPRGVPPYRPAWGYLFNSYYEAVGPRHERPRRGVLSRPSVDEITAYRRAIDERLVAHLQQASGRALAELTPIVELGLAHEEQHQELLLTDVLHAFAQNPLAPAYREGAAVPAAADTAPLRWIEHGGGLVEIGARQGGFHFDNEAPRHRVWLEPFALASRLATMGELRAFVDEGGYRRPELWLSEGWEWVQRENVVAPAYVRGDGDGAWRVFGLDGERDASPAEPAAFLSYYEADALARFLGARLPTEAEWEAVAAQAALHGNWLDTDALRPLPAPHVPGGTAPQQLFGDAWEWTRSAYEAYPGYAPAAGALGEYNGKFMVSQLVLRGGSCFTPAGHVRASYRNFWHPDTRFQVTGVRLARSV